MAASSSAAGAAGGQLPEHMQIQRDNVICGADLNYHVSQKLSGDYSKCWRVCSS